METLIYNLKAYSFLGDDFGCWDLAGQIIHEGKVNHPIHQPLPPEGEGLNEMLQQSCFQSIS